MQPEPPLLLAAGRPGEDGSGPSRVLRRDAVLHVPIVPGQAGFASATRTRSTCSGDSVPRSSVSRSSRRAAAR